MLDVAGQGRQHAVDIVGRLEAEMLVEPGIHLGRRERHRPSPSRIDDARLNET